MSAFDAEILIGQLRVNPGDECQRLITADALEENCHGWAADALRAGRIPVTALDAVAILRFAEYRFMPGTFPKRFSRSLAEIVRSEKHPTVTPRQYHVLWEMLWNFRRQIHRTKVNAEAFRIHEARTNAGTVLGNFASIYAGDLFKDCEDA